MHHGVDPRDDLAAMARLRRLAESTKIDLSSQTEVTVREELLTSRAGRPVNLELTVTRRELEAMILPLIESTIALAERALADAAIEPGELDRIVLVGGSTRIPLVRRLLRERFVLGGDEGDGIAARTEIHDEVDPDLAVALGAAIQAGILADAPVERLLVDVAAHSLGLRVVDGRLGDDDIFAPIIPRNTVLPATRTEEFYTAFPDQERIEVEVYQGDERRASANTLVGTFFHELRPSPVASPIGVAIAYDLDGMVKVTISQPGVGPSEPVSFAVADKAREAAPSSASAIERKSAALLETLSGRAKDTLAKLLERYRAATGKARAEAEEDLLDFFLDHGED